MATIYTKTALKKIKKDELIQMFLDQQAQINDIKMEFNDFVSVFDGNVSMKKMTEENKKLKEENEKLKKQKDGWVQRSKKVRESYDECVYKKVEIIKELREEGINADMMPWIDDKNN